MLISKGSAEIGSTLLYLLRIASRGLYMPSCFASARKQLSSIALVRRVCMGECGLSANPTM